MIEECTFKQLEVSLVRLELSTKCSLFSIVLWSKKKGTSYTLPLHSAISSFKLLAQLRNECLVVNCTSKRNIPLELDR